MVSVALPTDRSDINSNYNAFYKDLQIQDPVTPSINPKTQQEDYFRNFRTYTVLLWFFSNAIVIVALTNGSIYSFVFKESLPVNQGGEFNPYLRVLFVFLIIVSFLLCSAYIIYSSFWILDIPDAMVSGSVRS